VRYLGPVETDVALAMTGIRELCPEPVEGHW
jgi:hypothetical protein